MRKRGPPRSTVKQRLASSAPVAIGLAVAAGWVALSLLHHVYLALLVPALVAIGSIARAWWIGARPEVVDFGRDSAGAALDVLRRPLGISRRERRDDE